MTLAVAQPKSPATSARPETRATALRLVLHFAALTLGVAALGWLLVHVLMHTSVGANDRSIERTLGAHRTTTWNHITYITTWLAETPTIALLTGLLAVIARIAWKRWRDFLFVVLAVVGETQSFALVTLLVHRSRPPISHLDVAPPTSSFPSGHTAASVAFYGALALLLSARVRNRALSIVLWTLAFLVPLSVALSRMYRGMHYPTDVSTGAALGLVWLVLVATTIGPWSRYESGPSR